MNGLFGKRPGFQPNKPKIRVERVLDAPKPKPLPSKIAASHRPKKPQTESLIRSANSSARSSPARQEENGSGRLKPAKRKPSRQISPVHQPMESDSEDDQSPTNYGDMAHKKQKSDRPIDKKRQLLSRQGFSDEDGGVFGMIHAADISAAESKAKLAAGANGLSEEVTCVELQYPSASQRERYHLVFGKDQIDPAEEIIKIAEHVVEVYLTDAQATVFKEPNSGVIRQIAKSKYHLTKSLKSKVDKDLKDAFMKAVDLYNTMISDLVDDGALAKNLEAIHHLPLGMVKTILQQVYDRAVSPQVEILTRKRAEAENEKDNTYGELLPSFVSEALTKAGLKSDQYFVDLGSGVGNVVLQAALEFGSDSFGCEMMENACRLAKEQEKEFAARCRLWGINTGEVQLEQGSFFESQATHEAIKKADVILVNNEVFSADTNNHLIGLFLDCKDGCKIISLQPFVEPGHEITERNIHDPRNQLDVEREEYGTDYVSWKNAGGDYYISTKDSKRLEAFEKHF